MQVLDQILDMRTNVEKKILYFRVMSYGQRGLAFKEQSLVQIECHQNVLELFHMHRLYYFSFESENLFIKSCYMIYYW